MVRPVFLAVAYLIIAVLWQAVLWSVLPNTGMGGLAVMYLVWPCLALSAVCLWPILTRIDGPRLPIFFAASLAMLLGTLWLHPQDSSIGIARKLSLILAQG